LYLALNADSLSQSFAGRQLRVASGLACWRTTLVAGARRRLRHSWLWLFSRGGDAGVRRRRQNAGPLAGVRSRNRQAYACRRCRRQLRFGYCSAASSMADAFAYYILTLGCYAWFISLLRRALLGTYGYSRPSFFTLLCGVCSARSRLHAGVLTTLSVCTYLYTIRHSRAAAFLLFSQRWDVRGGTRCAGMVAERFTDAQDAFNISSAGHAVCFTRATWAAALAQNTMLPIILLVLCRRRALSPPPAYMHVLQYNWRQRVLLKPPFCVGNNGGRFRRRRR